MSREHPEVRLHRGDFSGKWWAVRVAEDGETITDKWPIHPDDAARYLPSQPEQEDQP